MVVLPDAIGTYVLAHIVCACIALGVGFIAGVWFFGAKRSGPNQSPPKKPPSKKNLDEFKRTAERIALATSRISDLTTGVASDVGDHAAKMKLISADLAGIDRESAGANVVVLAAMDQILNANSELQQRLEAAEKQLAAQAVEIKVHESEARTDALTGLANRRAFDDELKRRMHEWDRRRTPVALVLLDIDFFKEFNDAHGHQIGDEILRQVATTLRSQAREIDLPCRYGGEEFAVILPATDTSGACIAAERIRNAIEDSTTKVEGKSLKVTCSIGVSQIDLGDDAARFIRRADNALYYSKRHGRNCGYWTDGTSYEPIGTPATPTANEYGSVIEPLGDDGKSRRSFTHELKRRVAESHRFGIPLSVLHLKIEEYDAVAKDCGKTAARQMIDVAETAIEKVLREMDVLARLNNGEFIMMLPGKTASDSAMLLKRMQITMAGLVVSHKGRELRVRLLDGIAELRPNETARELATRARLEMPAPAATR